MSKNVLLKYDMLVVYSVKTTIFNSGLSEKESSGGKLFTFIKILIEIAQV